MSQSKHRRHGKTRPRLNLQTGRVPRIHLERDTRQALKHPVVFALFCNVLFRRLQEKYGGNQWEDWTDDQFHSEAALIIRGFEAEEAGLPAPTVSAA